MMIYHGCIDSEILSKSPEFIVVTMIASDVVGAHSSYDQNSTLSPYCCICNKDTDLALCIYIPQDKDIRYPLFDRKCGMTYFYIFCVCIEHEILLGGNQVIAGLPRIINTLPSFLQPLLVKYLKRENLNDTTRHLNPANKLLS